MGNNLRKMQYVLFALLMFALTACGTTQSTGTGQTPGKLTANVTMPTAKSVAAQVLPTTVRLIVTGKTIPTAKQDFPGSTGGTIQVYPGSQLIVSAYGYDANGNLLYEGFAVNQTVASGGTTNVTIQLNAPVVKAENAPCLACHETTRDATGQNLIADYKQSGHYANTSWKTQPENGSTLPGCAGCHGTQHNTLNPATAGRCYDCHGAVSVPGHNGDASTSLTAFQFQCDNCHNSHNTTAFAGAGCTTCHDVAQNLKTTNYVNDNTGVRAIMPEFAKTSHHIVNANGAPPTDKQCIACHMEGTVSNGVVVVDKTKHMVDASVHLRNGNTTLAGNQSAANGAEYIWDPANPNHTAMDQFCMSCHNSAGATAVAALNLAGQTATNPFGDTISNGVDGVARSAVVPVFDQFDPNNNSHHAVRAAKYSGRTRATTANPSVFTQYSGAAVMPIWNTNPAFVVGSTSTGHSPAASLHTNSLAGIGPTSPGTRKTIYEAGFFVSSYTPLGDTKSVADDSIIHCGDCHTVGQFKPGSTTNADGVATTEVIGAHGSTNEYMLRTSTGIDEIHVNAEYAAETQTTPGTNIPPAGTQLGVPYNMNTGVGGPVRPTGGITAPTNVGENFYVCFLCHKANVYGATEKVPFAANPTLTYGETRMGGHGGLHPCNDPVDAESTGKVGSARVTYFGGGEKGGGNLFGYTCAHCHNAGNKGFGGIHGSNATYGNYSTDGTWANNAAVGGSTDANVKRVNRPTYRFMGGLSLKYNGGATASKWESQVLQKSNREGCYNFSVNTQPGSTATVTTGTINGKDFAGNPTTGASLPTALLTQWRTDAANAGEFNDGTSGAQIFGTWGACGHHNGSVATGANATSLRKVQRPLKY